MDTEQDHINEGTMAGLGLSPEDFRKWVIEEGFTTENELAWKPGFVSDLMNTDNVWNAYVECKRHAKIAEEESLRDQLQRRIK